MPAVPERDPLEAFREQLLKDLRSGTVHSILDYLERFPADPDALAREFVALQSQENKGSRSSDHVGPYRVRRELGRGGQGVVYLADDERLNRRVALKVLTRLGPGSEEVLQRFQREAEVASKLAHPGICTVYDAGVSGGVPYIAMQFVEGVSLAARIAEVRSTAFPEDQVSLLDFTATTVAEEGDTPRREITTGEIPISGEELPRLPREEVLRVAETFERIALALHAAHEAGIIHRDVKPGNVMLTADGLPVILDFGLARDTESGGQTLTRSGDFLGTPAYMSPEQVEGDHRRIDRRSDVWSLGATLYECLTLVRPFQGATRQQLYRAIAEESPVPMRYLNPGVGRDLQVVVETCLRKDPNDRYQSAADLAEDLRRARELEPLRARPLSRTQRTLRWARRHPARAGLLASLLVLGPLLTGLLVYISATAEERETGRKLELAARIEDRLDRGYFEFGEGSDREAAREFAAALELNEADVEARAGHALALLELGRFDAARAVLAAAPDPARLACIETEIARRATGDEGDAPPVKAASTRPEDLFVAGLVEMSRGHDGEPQAFWRAERHFARAVTRWPERPRRSWYTEWLHAIGHIGQAERCREIADVATGLWPDSEPLWFHAGRALTLVDAKKAVHWLRRFQAARPDDPLGLCALAKALIEAKEIDAARPLVARAMELAPEQAETHAARAALAHNTQDWPTALAAYEKQAELLGESTRLLDNISRALSMMERDEAAGAVLRKLAARAPHRGDIRMRLAYTALMRRDFEEAIAHYEKAAELDPGNATYWVCLGECYHNFGRFDESLDAYQRARAVAAAGRPVDMPLDDYVKGAEAKLRLSHRLDDIRVGSAVMRGRDDLVGLLDVATLRSLPVSALDLWDAALAGKLEVPEDLKARPHLHAVRDALKAGLGTLDPTAPWLERVRRHLESELADLERRIRAPRRLARYVRKMLEEPDIAALRESVLLDSLDAKRRAAWQRLWREVDRLEAE